MLDLLVLCIKVTDRHFIWRSLAHCLPQRFRDFKLVILSEQLKGLVANFDCQGGNAYGLITSTKLVIDVNPQILIAPVSYETVIITKIVVEDSNIIAIKWIFN